MPWTRGVQVLAQPLPHHRTCFISLHLFLNHYFFRHTLCAFPLGEETTDTQGRKHSEGCRGYNIIKRIHKQKSKPNDVMETGAERVSVMMRSNLDKEDAFSLTLVVWGERERDGTFYTGKHHPSQPRETESQKMGYR